jgi:hypothetical protein
MCPLPGSDHQPTIGARETVLVGLVPRPPSEATAALVLFLVILLVLLVLVLLFALGALLRRHLLMFLPVLDHLTFCVSNRHRLFKAVRILQPIVCEILLNQLADDVARIGDVRAWQRQDDVVD